MEERLAATEQVQANLVNQVAEIENASASVEAPTSNMNDVLQSADEWSEQREREQMEHQIEELKLGQQVEAAQRNAERAFGRPN